MSIVSSNIISKNITELENLVSSQSYQIKNLIDNYSGQNKRSFDQTTKQNVIISFNTTTKIYRFEIQKNQENKENDVFMYQVWKKNNNELNSNRKYQYIGLRSWITEYRILKNKENYTPTTLIELNGLFYPTVLVDANIENDLCVFYFDSRTISPGSGFVENILPQSGSYNNARFDIDDGDICSLCMPKSGCNPDILSLIPTTININDGMTLTRTGKTGYVFTNNAFGIVSPRIPLDTDFIDIYRYDYSNNFNNNCDVKPLTLILTTYADLTITNVNKLVSEFIKISISPIVSPVIISNVFLSMEVFIGSTITVKNLFINFCDKSVFNNGDNGDNNSLLTSLFNVNDQTPVVLQPPGCTFDLNTRPLNPTNDYLYNNSTLHNSSNLFVNYLNSIINSSYFPSPINFPLIYGDWICPDADGGGQIRIIINTDNTLIYSLSNPPIYLKNQNPLYGKYDPVSHKLCFYFTNNVCSVDENQQFTLDNNDNKKATLYGTDSFGNSSYYYFTKQNI